MPVAKQHRCSKLAVRIQFRMREQLSQLDAMSYKESLACASRQAVRACLCVPASGI